jgi:hypothetical protein
MKSNTMFLLAPSLSPRIKSEIGLIFGVLNNFSRAFIRKGEDGDEFSISQAGQVERFILFSLPKQRKLET